MKRKIMIEYEIIIDDIRLKVCGCDCPFLQLSCCKFFGRLYLAKTKLAYLRAPGCLAGEKAVRHE